MPIESLAEGILGGILRFLLWIIVEIIFELLIKGLGWLLCRPFKKYSLQDNTCAIVGVIAWCVIIASLIWICS